MDFITCFHNAGIDPADVDLSRVGVWQRLPTIDKPNRRNGRVMIFNDRPLRFWYSNLATAISGYYADSDVPGGSFVSRPDFGRMIRARKQQESEREQSQADAAQRAVRAWNESAPADPLHPYLVQKGVQPHGIRELEDHHLVIPMRFGGLIWSVQTIAPDGSKRYLAGGRKTGCYCAIGSKPDDVLLLAEGFATGASLFECLSLPVAICFDAGNLLPVGLALRKQHPSVELIFCADNDLKTAGNPGVAHAKAAAAATRGYVVVPEFGLIAATKEDLTDFNDMHRRYGRGFVRDHFKEVLAFRAEARALSDPTITLIAPQPLGLITQPASEIEPIEIAWLWFLRIALGKLLLIAGDPGLGKSLLTLFIAAIVSRGGKWPVDGTVSPLGSVLIVSAEDDAADTIVPRLIAAGADLAKVHILDHVAEVSKEGDALERELSLERDVDMIEQRVAELGDCKLVIIDPISAYLGRIDTHRNSEVRSVLAPLSKLAQRLGVAIAAVTHLNKGAGTSADYRISGSIAFTAAVRASLLVTKDKDDPSRRLVLPGKTNTGPDSLGGLAYRVAQNAAGKPYLEFETEAVMISADDALDLDNDDEKKYARTEAADFLRDLLRLGPVASPEVIKAANAAGVSKRTLDRAKAEIGVTSGRNEFTGGWYWSLPNNANLAKTTNSSSDGNLGESGNLGNSQDCQISPRLPAFPMVESLAMLAMIVCRKSRYELSRTSGRSAWPRH